MVKQFALTERCPNGDVPKSPLLKNGSLMPSAGKQSENQTDTWPARD
jgi:hypothetical protein